MARCTCGWRLTEKGVRSLAGQDDDRIRKEIVPVFRERFPTTAARMTDDQIVEYYRIVLAKMSRGCLLHGPKGPGN